MYAALATVVPVLALAGAGWIQADAARKEAETQKLLAVEQEEKKEDLANNYSEYIVDRMKRDEALQMALASCMEMLRDHDHPSAEPEPPAPHAPAVDLDEVAEEFGYEQETAP